jgi:hypothetical protein
MNRTVVKTRIGDDGVLHLDIPFGAAQAGRTVQVVIDPEAAKSKTQQEYWDFLDQTAGAWQGEFERPDQGEFETRDQLP